MRSMTLKEIASACGGRLVSSENANELTINDITIDSRTVKEGSLYIPIKGQRFDGHDFIDQVFENGAVCTLTESERTDLTKPQIVVESTAAALRDIAEYYRSLFGKLKVIGVTGSSGKTSTKEMIYSVLSEHFNVLKTEGNLNNEIGVPKTIFRITDEHEVAIIEMGINHFGEMTRLAKMVRPDIAVITNIGTAHLEFLESRDGILKAKTEMLPFLAKDGTAVLNGDDDKLCTVDSVKTSFFGFGEKNDIRAENIVQKGIDGTAFTIVTKDIRLNAFVPALGKHMVMNAVAAFRISELLGMPAGKALEGISHFKNIDGRFNVIKTDSFTLINDCYNANPDSVKASLKVIGTLPGRKAAVLADMKELGENSEKMHRETGAFAAECLDTLICIGPEALFTYEEAKKANPYLKAVHYNNNDEAKADMLNILEKSDTVLIKGSHSMNLSEITSFLKETCI
ncbi:MAG: UDP-N-acetylmuramoyl-tripeptide--D-alanyl-D-alanine ligase [Oscillospiraceae bacterium]|nr:UDP-N-acetylmuramoyl-tripeptide--D-alanyl-D-alanine ligase [Oscillospiraceae bacterium]